jgi:hypothetical protein
MTTGLFPIKQREGGPRRGIIPRNRRAANGKTFAENKVLFAEALASGATSAVAAGAAIGVSRNAALRLFKAIRAELGWQAV